MCPVNTHPDHHEEKKNLPCVFQQLTEKTYEQRIKTMQLGRYVFLMGDITFQCLYALLVTRFGENILPSSFLILIHIFSWRVFAFPQARHIWS